MSHKDARPDVCSGDGVLSGQLIEHDATASDMLERRHEPIRVLALALTEPKRLFIQIPEQMKRFDADVGPADAALQQ